MRKVLKMISINNLSVEYTSKPIFSDISFFINSNDKIALVGKNGAGKSTLLKVIAGLENPTYGSVNMSSDITIGYLPQQMKIIDKGISLLEEVKKVFKERWELEEEIEKLNIEIENHKNPESKEFIKLLEKVDFINNLISHQPLSEIQSDIEKILTGLGFLKSDYNRKTSEFSGGWRIRIELAKILLKKPDVLLLDEPTNHLDIESIQWLENFIATKGKTVLLVSHDRKFMDNITSRTIELSCGKIYDYKVNFSAFQKLRKERIEQQKKAYENQQRQIAEAKAFIERFRYQATKANQVQSRIKQLEKIIPIEIDETDNREIRIKFPPAERSGDYPLIIKDLKKSFGDHDVLKNADLTLRRGEKVAFVGKNGQGKTTLVKCILNDIDYNGTIKIGHNIKIGYFAQNQAQLLDGSLTIYQTIDNVATGDIRNRINDILGAFKFGGEESEKKVEVLSGGEKTRLAMIKLLLEPVNLLILDEPTNHLDINSKEILKYALKQFDGTLIVVSHDRAFLEGLVEKVYEFKDGKVIEHLGGIEEFLYNNKLASLQDIEKNDNSENKKAEKEERVIKERQLSYKDQKERDRKIKRLNHDIKKIEKKIEDLENEISEIENKLNSQYSDKEITIYSDLKKELEKAMGIWEELQNETDNL